MQKANRAHMLVCKDEFYTWCEFLLILFYLNAASVVSSMEFPGFSEIFSEIKLLVAMVTMMSFIVFS